MKAKNIIQVTSFLSHIEVVASGDFVSLPISSSRSHIEVILSHIEHILLYLPLLRFLNSGRRVLLASLLLARAACGWPTALLLLT